MDPNKRFEEKFPFCTLTSIHKKKQSSVGGNDDASSDGNNRIRNEQRRHSWTSSAADNTPHKNEHNRTFNAEYSAAFERLNIPPTLNSLHCSGSRPSSSASSPEAIEECSSGEEKEKEVEASVDYINCKNCKRNDNGKEMEVIPLQNINYCFNCKHLFLQENRNPFAQSTTMAFQNVRRSSWQAGDAVENHKLRGTSKYPSSEIRVASGGMSSGRTSRSRSRESVDLPVISEPASGEEESNSDCEENLNSTVK